MVNKKILLGTLLAGAALSTTASAHDGDVAAAALIGLGIGAAVAASNGYAAPMVVAPPAYYAPPPPMVVYRPAPVYVAPAPVYVTPAPVYYRSYYRGGWRGHEWREHRRHWDRD